MTHRSGCIRSDGDWLCAPGCTHDRDEARREYNEKITGENAIMRRVLTEIAQGHSNPVLHAQSTLSSLNSEDKRVESIICRCGFGVSQFLHDPACPAGPLCGVWCVNDRVWCPDTIGTQAYASAQYPRWASGEAAAVDGSRFKYEVRDFGTWPHRDRPMPIEAGEHMVPVVIDPIVLAADALRRAVRAVIDNPLHERDRYMRDEALTVAVMRVVDAARAEAAPTPAREGLMMRASQLLSLFRVGSIGEVDARDVVEAIVAASRAR